MRKKPTEGLPALYCIPFLQLAMMNGMAVVDGKWDGYGLRFEDMVDVGVPHVCRRGYIEILLQRNCVFSSIHKTLFRLHLTLSHK
jgi:hypothetical protein